MKLILITVCSAVDIKVRIDEIPVRGLKHLVSRGNECAVQTGQNRRNPRQGIETQSISRFPSFRFFVRIDEIPVRGLKLWFQGAGHPGRSKVRIDEIPVRGLKPDASYSALAATLTVRIDEIPVRGLKHGL